MLKWKRITNEYEWERDHITGDYIRFGEYYLKDDEDGLVVSAKTYANLKEQKKYDEFDYSKLNNAANEREYEQILKNNTKEFLSQHLLERPIERGAY